MRIHIGNPYQNVSMETNSLCSFLVDINSLVRLSLCFLEVLIDKGNVKTKIRAGRKTHWVSAVLACEALGSISSLSLSVCVYTCINLGLN